MSPAATESWQAVAHPLFAGMLAAGYAVLALYFLRFWNESRDRLFLYFAAAFALLAVQRIALSFARDLGIAPVILYILRLLAFVLILGAIVDKNRASRPTDSRTRAR